MPSSIIITHLTSPPPSQLPKHPRCLSKVLSTQHSPGDPRSSSLLFSQCKKEAFIPRKLHFNKATSWKQQQSPGQPRPAQQPSYPVVFHYFWEHLNEEDIQSATCQREERERQSISLNQLIGSQTTKPTRSQLEVAPLSLSLSLWSEEWQHRAEQVS